ncbi:MAG: hypothetical protein M9921_09930 [Fimbriimonadaceae bacterium]|nr:hypothetical protein [Chthonomonadaceae bacterium]MCO5297163.1 hypothetical protein [Fimbriimonadaceae bacterium]
MMRWMRQLDKLLRGEATQPDALQTGKIEFPARGILTASVLLAGAYGICMSLFAVMRSGGSVDGWLQMLASTIKLPLLFFLTLVVTLPSLYVFNTLVGARLSLLSVVNLLVASLAVIVAVLASLGPIVVFFSLSTTSHPFMVLLNVVAATVAGTLGLKFLFRTLNRLAHARTEREPEPVGDRPPPLPKVAIPAKPGALEADGLAERADARSVFRIWVLVFSLVGAQMSWVLRPFVGSPNLPFEWFRPKEDNFFVAVFHMIQTVLGGG